MVQHCSAASRILPSSSPNVANHHHQCNSTPYQHIRKQYRAHTTHKCGEAPVQFNTLMIPTLPLQPSPRSWFSLDLMKNVKEVFAITMKCQQGAVQCVHWECSMSSTLVSPFGQQQPTLTVGSTVPQQPRASSPQSDNTSGWSNLTQH